MASVIEEQLVKGISVMKYNSHGGIQDRILWLNKAAKRLLIHKRKTEDGVVSESMHLASTNDPGLRRAQSFFGRAREVFQRHVVKVSNLVRSEPFYLIDNIYRGLI